jgi:hypothetical protein
VTASETRFIYWAFILLGSVLLISGWLAIRRQRTRAEGREYEGRAASRLGRLWVVLGLLLVAAALFRIGVLVALGRLFIGLGS